MCRRTSLPGRALSQGVHAASVIGLACVAMTSRGFALQACKVPGRLGAFASARKPKAIRNACELLLRLLLQPRGSRRRYFRLSSAPHIWPSSFTRAAFTWDAYQPAGSDMTHTALRPPIRPRPMALHLRGLVHVARPSGLGTAARNPISPLSLQLVHQNIRASPSRSLTRCNPGRASPAVFT